MARQAELNGHSGEQATVSEVTSHFSGLAYDLITLAELQARLLFLDVREASRRSAVTLVCLAVMAVFTVSAVPVCLLGIAELLVDLLDWHRPVAYLTVGGVAAFGAIFGGILAARRLVTVSAVFGRSHQELQDNLEFIKRLVRGPDSED
jgi:hypothetical protein